MSDMRTALVIEGRVDPSVGATLRKATTGVGAASATTVKATGAATKALSKQAEAGRTLAAATTGVGKATATAARRTQALGEATRRTEREARGAGSAMRRWARDTRRTNTALGRTVRKVEEARVAFRRLSRESEGGGLGDLISGAAAGGAVRSGWREALAYEDAGVRLGTVINAEDTAAALGESMRHARQIARRGLATETELLNIQYALNSAGMEAEAARLGSTVVSKVKTVTNGAPEAVAEVMATVYNNLGHQLEGTAAERFTRVGELLTKTQFKYQIRDFNQLGESFKTGAGAIARFNVPLAQGATLLGVLNSAGLQGSEGGTAFTAVLRQLTKAQKDLGVEIVRNADGQMDAVATLENVRTALDAYDTDERNAIMQQVFGDEGAKALTPLLQQLDKLRREQKDVEEGSRLLLDKSYQTFLEGGSGPLAMFMDNLKSVGATIGSSLLPAVNAVVGPLNDLLIAVGELIEEFPLLGQAIGVAAAGFAAFKAYKILQGAGSFLGGIGRAGGRRRGGVAGVAGALGGVIPVRVVNFPGGGMGPWGGDLGPDDRDKASRRPGPGRRGAGVGRWLKGAGKVLGRAAIPLGLGMAAWDIADGIGKGDTEQVGGGLGGLGGGLAGAAAGAAIGSVVPVIGTAIGGLIGGVAGAFGGEWLGRSVGGLFSDDDGKAPPTATDAPPAPPAGSGAAAALPPPPVALEGGRPSVTNTFHIAIQAAPGQDVEAVAEAVMRRLKTLGREALYD